MNKALSPGPMRPGSKRDNRASPDASVSFTKRWVRTKSTQPDVPLLKITPGCAPTGPGFLRGSVEQELRLPLSIVSQHEAGAQYAIRAIPSVKWGQDPQRRQLSTAGYYRKGSMGISGEGL